MAKKKKKQIRKISPAERPEPPTGVVLPADAPDILLPQPEAWKAINIKAARKNRKGPTLLQGVGPSETIFNVTDNRPIKLIIRQHQSPGDILMLTAAIRDLHKAYPAMFLTAVDTAADALFENSPYIVSLDKQDPEVFIIQAEYPLVHKSNEGPWHFIEAFHEDFSRKLGLSVLPTTMRGDIHISEQEKSWFSQIYEIVGRDVPFWLIDAGCKSDYTNKLWERARFQEVVSSLPEITFVQIGLAKYEEEVDDGKGGKRSEVKNKDHMHVPLEGDNVINLLNKTNIRELVRLMYHACGVITPVSFPMHLCAAVPVKDVYKRKTRPCIVIAGGREPNQWEAYANHQFLHTCGQLSCCDNGGCWKSRIEPLDDSEHHNDSLCINPVVTPSGQKIPKCMDMITAAEVIMHVRRYMEEWNYYKDWDQ